MLGEEWEDFIPPDPMFQADWNRQVAEWQRLEMEMKEKEAASAMPSPPAPPAAAWTDGRPRGRSRSPDNEQRTGRGGMRERTPPRGGPSRGRFRGDGPVDERIPTRRPVVRSRVTPAPVRDARMLGPGVVAQVPNVIPGLGEDGEDYLDMDGEGDVGMRGL